MCNYMSSILAVCVYEFDISHFEKAYIILDEFLLVGKIWESSKKNVLKAVEQADLL